MWSVPQPYKGGKLNFAVESARRGTLVGATPPLRVIGQAPVALVGRVGAGIGQRVGGVRIKTASPGKLNAA